MTICLTLIWGKSTILIDAGMPRHFKAIRQGMEEYGDLFETLKAVISTHHEVDQVPEMLSNAGHEIKICANWSGCLILRGIRVIFTPGIVRPYQSMEREKSLLFFLYKLFCSMTRLRLLFVITAVFSKGSRISG
ncbi:MBL fold metallo-hydrolase [Bacillus inaquosorum]|uniref:hypothetical protein n=1 Tax=Bacillus inaquosorum TaxID=483913 RepID=UPI002DB66818|nr:hypothetical protein [Bacillus inaquosorum]MEC2062992.1 hypothetical protein [Bacillus inaquosorum]MEC2085865.1 hypothetical protein [Bacillus inaquosorum]